MDNPKKSAEDILAEAREQRTGSRMSVLKEADFITLLEAGGRRVSATISHRPGYYQHQVLYEGHSFTTISPQPAGYFEQYIMTK